MAKKFDMAAAVKESLGDVNVSKVDTVRMIPVELIDPNPKNFYEMSDLEELAGSIEAWGLVHPIKVSPADGRYVITDGERRFRATKEILGRTEIQCIVSAQVNTLLEEMQLIEANRTQRKMSAADLSKQAERYTELLAQLKEAGVAIPGRLRDRVAEALQVSSTKLARLHAIRENSVPRVLALFDDGTLNESAAYSLQQLPEKHQQLLAETAAIAGKGLSGYDVHDLDGYLKRFDGAKCDDGQACEHVQERLTMLQGGPSWSRHCTGCCRDCGWLYECKIACPKLADVVAKKNAERKESLAAQRAEAKARDEERKARKAASWERADRAWARFRELREARGVEANDPRFVKMFGFYGDECDLCRYESRDVEDYDRDETPLDMISSDEIVELMGILNCSADDLLGVSKVDHKPAGLEWHRIDPEHKPLFDFQKTVLLWGPGGLRSVPQHLIYDTIKYAPETVTHWAVVEGPEEDV